MAHHSNGGHGVADVRVCGVHSSLRWSVGGLDIAAERDLRSGSRHYPLQPQPQRDPLGWFFASAMLDASEISMTADASDCTQSMPTWSVILQ